MTVEVISGNPGHGASVASRVSNRIDAAFQREELAGLRLAVRARLAALAVIGLWLIWLVGLPEALYYEALLLIFAGIGVASYQVARSPYHQAWHKYIFLTADLALMSFTLTIPNPLIETTWPTQMISRTGTFVYFLWAFRESCGSDVGYQDDARQGFVRNDSRCGLAVGGF